MEAYLDAKARLFTPEYTRRGVVCVDDQWGRRLADRIEGAGLIPVDRLRAYPADGADGADGSKAAPADWWVSDAAVSMTDSATTFGWPFWASLSPSAAFATCVSIFTAWALPA